MRRFCVAIVFVFSVFSYSNVYSQSFDPDQLAQMAEGFELDRSQIESMVDLLERTGQISADQAKKAKQELGKMSDDDISALREQAVQKIEGASSEEELMPQNLLNSGEKSESSKEMDYQETLRSLGN